MSVSVTLWNGRIDARDDLCRALGVPPSATDNDLVARAFERWGDDAPTHILGDFAIAVWDESRRRLVLARDRFGVRPLYFVRETNIVSSDLASLIAKDEPLDETAINDFLLFGQGRDPARTTFARIERVPPAHIAILDEHGVRFRR